MICAVLAHAAFSPSIRVTDGLAPAALAALKAGGANVVSEPISDGSDLAAHDAVIIRSATTLGADALAAGAAGKLRVVGRAGVGVDNIDLAAAAAAGLWVLNTPGASTASVVELTLAHLLASTRQLATADRGLREGRWLKAELAGFELGGKRLGLLGFGRIAQGVARAATALGMEVDAHSPRADAAVAAALGVRLHASPEELFAACTHVSVHCALTERTAALVDASMLARMPQAAADGTPCGAHLVNMARGGIVVEADAAAALGSGTLRSYAADVFEAEPLPASSPLLACDGFVGTPHVGGATFEAQARVGLELAAAVLAALGGSRPADGVVCEGTS